MIKIIRGGKVEAELDGPIFIGPCILESEKDCLLCCIPDGLHHIFISARDGDGITVIE